MAVIDIVNGAASSVTEASPSRSRPRMARRVGSARAANTSSTARGSERLYRTIRFSIESAQASPRLARHWCVCGGVGNEQEVPGAVQVLGKRRRANGGRQPRPAQEAMGLWMAWMEKAGPALVDPGSPLGEATELPSVAGQPS